MPVPPTIAWTLGAIAATALAKLLIDEWKRVNADLERVRKVRISDSDRAAMPKLRRDPATGVYRPYR